MHYALQIYAIVLERGLVHYRLYVALVQRQQLRLHKRRRLHKLLIRVHGHVAQPLIGRVGVVLVPAAAGIGE